MPIKVGTASWTDKSLIACKRFYPPGTSSAEGRLRYYASQFDLVEVDSSYYAMPSASNSRLWVERTPRPFTFNMKAWRLFTGHPTKREMFPRDLVAHIPDTEKNLYYRDIAPEVQDELWLRFINAVAPLEEADKLGAILLQFAPWTINNKAGRAHVQECVERLAGVNIAVEFRNRSWFDDAHRDDVLAWERDLQVSHVVVDAPEVSTANVIPAVWVATVPTLAIVRLHGRNAGTWNTKGPAPSDRFNYDYSDTELAELAGKIQALAQHVGTVHVIFNNNYEDQGQRNAATLRTMLD